MDDEDFNSELLGAAQRQHNLRQNEATRQEIAALRADLKRKEAAEKSAPKCPYCFGTITAGAVKCRHCTSDIKWCEVRGKSYPIKTDANTEQFAAQKKRELDAEKRAKEERRLSNKRVQKAAETRAVARKQEEGEESFLIILGLIVGVVIAFFPARSCGQHVNDQGLAENGVGAFFVSWILFSILFGPILCGIFSLLSLPKK